VRPTDGSLNRNNVFAACWPQSGLRQNSIATAQRWVNVFVNYFNTSRIVYFIGLCSLFGVKKKTVCFGYFMGKAAPAIAPDLTFSLRMVADSFPERRCLCFESRPMAEAHKINNSKCGIPSTETYWPVLNTCSRLTLCCRFHPEKLLVPQLLKKFPTFYRSQNSLPRSQGPTYIWHP